MKIITHWPEKIIEPSRTTIVTKPEPISKQASVQQTRGTVNASNKYGPHYSQANQAADVFTGILDAL